jgi:UDP-glucose 6-dehydrogenase
MDEIDNIILETLSFFEPMTKEMVILDIDKDRVQALSDFSIEELEKRLENLVKQKLVKREKKSGDVFFLKQMKKRPWWKRFF